MRFAFICLLICSGLVWAQDEPRLIQITPSADFNVTQDDMARLRQLAGGIGWEFEQNDVTNLRLKAVGIKRIRCINVDPLEGHFDASREYHIVAPQGYNYVDRLKSHFATCRAIGAVPHVILAVRLPSTLVAQKEDLEKRGANLLGLKADDTNTYGPTDWFKYRNYLKAVFRFVLVEEQFADASFEVANEPDTGGTLFVERPPKPGPGSRGLYEAYLKIYTNVAMAANQFEQENPGVHVTLGGPAITWAYTFKFGDFNWTERFLRDVRNQKLRLDFIGLHFYGNLSPLTGTSTGTYPSFAQMMQKTRGWREQYTPKVPIWFTEWGATYCTSLDPQSLHNGNHVGAAWTAAFLNQMLVEGVDRAFYLVTTDQRQEVEGQWKDIWGWPAMFTNPSVLGVHPKAPYHVFQMLSRMAPKRVESKVPAGTLGCIASRDDKGRLTVLVWNNSYQITEGGPGTELGHDEAVTLRVANAGTFFKGPVHMRRSLVSKTVSNAFNLFEQNQKIDDRAELQQVQECTTRPSGDEVELRFVQPRSSVSFIELVTAGD